MKQNSTQHLVLGLSSAALLVAGTGYATTGSVSNPSSSPLAAAAAPAACTGETATPAGLVFGDVDGDGLDDAFVVGGEGQARLLMNFGEGRFEDVTLAANLAELGGATCALFADLDGDGQLDLFAGSSATRVWRNLGNATFEPMASGIDHDLVDLAAQAVDRDQDSRLDLQIHTEAGDLVYRNLGEGRFERLALPLGELTQAPAHVGWSAPDSVDATDPLAAPDAGTPAQRRLGRWVQGRAVGGFASAAASAPSGASSFGTPLPFLATCQPGVRDANGSACIGASSAPQLGKLYPLSSNLFVAPSGNVGIGTTSPNTKLEVSGSGVQQVRCTSTNSAAAFEFMSDGSGLCSVWSPTGTDDLFVNVGGSGRLSIAASTGLVSVKQSLEIRGGADIVERFSSSCGPLEPGTVVAIDPENPGRLACSFAAYDTKVAGVVSGAGGVKPGLCLGQDGVLEGETPVAMNGRVYVKCSTENGAIRPGDRLTTATLAGHAMKVTDAARADGAVIGKAMSALDEGTGLVLVLVNLQ